MIGKKWSAVLAAIAILAGLAQLALAQQPSRLYAGLVNSRGYVVGAKLLPSGLHVYETDTTWQLIGWTHPRVSAIAADPNNPDILYLACGNGAFKSSDGGASWRVTSGWEITEAQGICVDPKAPQNVYLSTSYGIWRSTDYGESWIAASTGLAKKYTQVAFVDRSRSGRLLAGTEGGLYESTDGAKSWSLRGLQGMAVLDLEQSPTNPEIWIAGTQKDGVWLSGDNGKSWRAATAPVAHTSIYGVAIDPFEPKNMAAAGWDTGVFLSRDGGATWQQHREGLPVPHIYELIFDANQAGALWVATVEEGIFRSADFAQTWQFMGMYGSVVFDMIYIPGK